MTGRRDAPCRLLLSAAVIGGCLLVLTVDQPYLGLPSTFLQKLVSMTVAMLTGLRCMTPDIQYRFLVSRFFSCALSGWTATCAEQRRGCYPEWCTTS